MRDLEGRVRVWQVFVEPTTSGFLPAREHIVEKSRNDADGCLVRPFLSPSGQRNRDMVAAQGGRHRNRHDGKLSEFLFQFP